jgi:hypothetical protein
MIMVPGIKGHFVRRENGKKLKVQQKETKTAIPSKFSTWEVKGSKLGQIYFVSPEIYHPFLPSLRTNVEVIILSIRS